MRRFAALAAVAACYSPTLPPGEGGPADARRDGARALDGAGGDGVSPGDGGGPPDAPPSDAVASCVGELDGTPCPAGGLCRAGACNTTDCWIEGYWHAPQAENPGYECQRCEPSRSRTAWTNDDDGTGCLSGLCHGGDCDGFNCFIGGTWYATGDDNPAQACEECGPSSSRTSWSTAPNGTACQGGGVDGRCHYGLCCVGCVTASDECVLGSSDEDCGTGGSSCQRCVNQCGCGSPCTATRDVWQDLACVAGRCEVVGISCCGEEDGICNTAAVCAEGGCL